MFSPPNPMIENPTDTQSIKDETCPPPDDVAVDTKTQLRVMMLANQEISSSLISRCGMMMLDKGIAEPARRWIKLTTRDPPTCLAAELNITLLRTSLP